MRHIPYLLAVLCLLGNASCKTASPDFCNASTPCTDPEASYCDVVGEHGPSNRCIAPPFQGACNELSPCADPELLCSPEGSCVECLESQSCPDDAPYCDATGSCSGCAPDADGDAACQARDQDGPLCLAAGICGECRGHGDCPQDRARCTEEGVCAACDQHDQCLSGYCLESGECAAEEQLVHASAVQGSDTAGCGAAEQPCRTITAAIDAVEPGRDIVMVREGLYTENLVVEKSLTLYGPGASLKPPVRVAITTHDQTVRVEGLTLVAPSMSNDGVALDCSLGTVRFSNVAIDGFQLAVLWASDCDISFDDSTITQISGDGMDVNRGSLTLRNTTFEGSPLQHPDYAIDIFDGSLDIEDSKLKVSGAHLIHLWGSIASLESVELESCSEAGVRAVEASTVTIRGSKVTTCNRGLHANDSVVEVFGSEFRDMDNRAVVAYDAEVVLERNLVTGCGSGVYLNGCSFRIENNFIVDNGGNSILTTALALVDASASLSPQLLRFNTLADNASPTDEDEVSGLRCDSLASIDSVGNIVYANEGMQITGDCNLSYSIVPSGTPGDDNFTVVPEFLGGDDYHLESDSPAIDSGPPQSDVSDDFDGDPRPLGERHDIGADEAG